MQENNKKLNRFHRDRSILVEPRLEELTPKFKKKFINIFNIVLIGGGNKMIISNDLNFENINLFFRFYAVFKVYDRKSIKDWNSFAYFINSLNPIFFSLIDANGAGLIENNDKKTN
tara:strand:+ start:10317 stop:10664 length:348 start_codon:yes stop_codon:yes gene_type:complete